jgi:hypothetical protein
MQRRSPSAALFSASAPRAISRRAAALAFGVALALLAPSAPPALAQTPLAPQTHSGVWRGQEQSPIGTMAVEVIFFPNGTYSRAHVAGSLMTRDVGTYSIVQNWIHFQLRDYEPKYYMNRPMTRPMTDTWVVNRFDGRVLQATVGGNSLVTVQRAQ